MIIQPGIGHILKTVAGFGSLDLPYLAYVIIIKILIFLSNGLIRMDFNQDF